MKIIPILLPALALTGVLLTGCGGKATETAAAASADAPQTVKISLFSWPGYAFWFIAKEKNLVPELNLEIAIIEDPYESFAQMAAGQLDVTSSTVEYGPIAAEKGVPVKLVTYTNPSYGTDKIILGPGINSAFDQVKYTNLIMDDAVAAMVSGKVAAGEFWEPFGGKVLTSLPGSKVAATSKDPYFKKTALLGDGMYMSGAFLENKPELAKLTLKAYFLAVKYWKENPAEANAIMAKGLKFPVEDVVTVIGADGSASDGGIYPFNFEEAARFMGVMEGQPPFGANNEISSHWKLTNDWWIKFGSVKSSHPMEAGVALAPFKALVAEGLVAP